MFQDFRLARFPYFAGQKHFVHHRVHLVEIEHQIQFANVVEIFVEDLDEIVYGLQVAQVVVAHVHADAEIQTGVPSVDYFEISEFHEIRVFGVPDRDDGVHLFDEFLFLVVVKVHVPFCQSRFARSVLYQYETNHFFFLISDRYIFGNKKLEQNNNENKYADR